MEVYVFFTVLGLGYIASKSTSNPQNAFKSDSLKQKKAIMYDQNIYNDTMLKQVKAIEEEKVRNVYKKSRDPHKTKVISSDYKDIINKTEQSSYESKLSGISIPIDDFKHNNMEPFFGGTKKQNVDMSKTNDFLLETFTGTGEIFHNQKIENVCFSDINENSGSSPYMKKDSYEETYDRMVTSKMKNNVLPFEQKNIGPGLNDVDSNQQGFYTNEREFVMPKTVDELRLGSNPKMNYKGRILDGQKGSKRGSIGKVDKNRASTYHERGAEHLFKTNGAYLKNKHRPCQIIKDTNRKHSQSYTGNIYKNIGNEQTGKLQESKKQILEEFGGRNLDNQKWSKPEWDFGKKNILVYSNERDLTTTKTYEGNLQSLVKSVIAPIQDALRTTPKQYTTFPKHEFGNLQTTNPTKLTIFDPTDVARTTIKETFIHDTRTGIATGEKASVVYDPDDVLKTTLKETLPDYENVINMKSHLTKQTVYDPNDTARTTIKETTEDSNRDGNIGTVEGGGAYETNEFNAPNTQKQFTSDREYMGSINQQNRDGYLTANMVAAETNKQFLSDNDYYGHAGSKDKKQMSYTDIYNATINETKETLLKGRKPTQSSTKVASGSDNVNIVFKKQDCESKDNQIIEKVYNTPSSKEMINTTKERYEEHENRLDPDILKAFHDNPYTKPLTDAV
jgi:hypothetical protein